MELQQVVRTLEALAPTSLAESWDNVGLLIQVLANLPSLPDDARPALRPQDGEDLAADQRPDGAGAGGGRQGA